MKKEILFFNFGLCQHYFNYVDSLLNSDPKSDDISLYIYQRELVDAATHLFDSSKALLDSAITACVDDMLLSSDNK